MRALLLKITSLLVRSFVCSFVRTLVSLFALHTDRPCNSNNSSNVSFAYCLKAALCKTYILVYDIISSTLSSLVLTTYFIIITYIRVKVCLVNPQFRNFPNYYYTLNFTVPDGGTLQVVMIDTVLLCGNTAYDVVGDQPHGPENPKVADDQWKWIESQLEAST